MALLGPASFTDYGRKAHAHVGEILPAQNVPIYSTSLCCEIWFTGKQVCRCFSPLYLVTIYLVRKSDTLETM